VKPVGKLGADYDAETYSDGTTVALEMKAKLEGKRPAVGSIVDTIDGARDQLPEGGAGAVFIRVPGNWGESLEGQAAMTSAVEKGFRSTGRISVVVFHWEKWLASPTAKQPQGAERGTDKRAELNPRARVPLPALADAIMHHSPMRLVPWLSFARLICSPAEQAGR
jgi:hypothetical protein